MEKHYFKNLYYFPYLGLLYTISTYNTKMFDYFINLPFDYTIIKPNNSLTDKFLDDSNLLSKNPELCLQIDFKDALIKNLVNTHKEIHDDELNYYIHVISTFKNREGQFFKFEENETNLLYGILGISTKRLFLEELLRQPLWTETYTQDMQKIEVNDIIYHNEFDGMCRPIIVLDSGENIPINIKIQENVNRLYIDMFLKYTNIYRYANFLYISKKMDVKRPSGIIEKADMLCSLEKLFRYFEFNNGRFAIIDIYPNSQDQNLNEVIQIYHM